MNKVSTGLLLLSFCSTAAIRAARSQSLVKPEDLSEAIRLLNARPLQEETLPCKIWSAKRARLDFLFRYNAGFSIDCNLGALRPGSTLTALIEVTPEGRPPVMLVEEFDVPHLSPEQITRFYSVPLNRVRISMSGGFALGAGRYSVEVLLSDGEGPTYRKHTSLKAGSGKDGSKMRLGLPEYSVAPLFNNWNRRITKNGLRVTVLFHADTFQRARIDAWETSDLLQSLTSLLDQLPCQSVKLIGFNLDRQTEVFDQEEFDGEGLAKLEKTLMQMEFVTIPYQALQPHSWQHFLINLARREVIQSHPDAVIILGQGGSHAWDKLPKEMVDEQLDPSSTRFFYFKYFDSTGPRDGLETLMKRVGGRTFAIYSPPTLQRAIADMLKELSLEDNQRGPKAAK